MPEPTEVQATDSDTTASPGLILRLTHTCGRIWERDQAGTKTRNENNHPVLQNQRSLHQIEINFLNLTISSLKTKGACSDVTLIKTMPSCTLAKICACTTLTVKGLAPLFHTRW